MRLLGVTVDSPQAIATRAVSDIQAIEQLVRSVPGQIDRALALAQDLVDTAHRILVISERLDRRAATILELGERLDAKASQLLELGDSMHELGGKIDETGAEIASQAAQVVTTAGELVTVLPTLERALDLASPLEGAIDRFGRMVDRFPGAATRRRPAEPPPESD